jgi:hypothetical protein
MRIDMNARITPQNPNIRFALVYNFSKLEVLKFKVPSLEPDRLPIVKITVKTQTDRKEYRIDTKQSLDDEMEQPVFDVDAVFPMKNEPAMTISQNTGSYIDIELEKGEWIEIEYSTKGGAKRVK